MDPWMILAPVILLASFTVIVGAPAFFIWLAVKKARWAHRRATRGHLYIPVTARVRRVWFSDGFATVWVSYEHDSGVIHNRFTVFDDPTARAAKKSGLIPLEIDPAYPRDVRVAESAGRS